MIQVHGYCIYIYSFSNLIEAMIIYISLGSDPMSHLGHMCIET